MARLVEVVANSAHHGVITAAQGRSYEHTLRAGRTLELSAITRMRWGMGQFGARFHCLPGLALALRDHALVLDGTLAERASLKAGEQEWAFAQGEGRLAALYHAKTRDWALGTAAGYRRLPLVRLGLSGNPGARARGRKPRRAGGGSTTPAR